MLSRQVEDPGEAERRVKTLKNLQVLQHRAIPTTSMTALPHTHTHTHTHTHGHTLCLSLSRTDAVDKRERAVGEMRKHG